MKLEGRIYCEGPDCENHAPLGLERFDDGNLTSLPPGFVRLVRYGSRDDDSFVFCCSECSMKWCSQIEPPVTIYPDPEDDPR